MFLFVRMIAYLGFGALAGQGFEFIAFDPETGQINISFHVDSVATGLTGLGGFAATWVSSRWAKAKGWLT